VTIVRFSVFSLIVVFLISVLMAYSRLPSFEIIQRNIAPREVLDQSGTLLDVSVRTPCPSKSEVVLCPPARVAEFADVKHLEKAILQQEDKRFFAHPGVDLIALANATSKYFLQKGSRGASTLEMQIARLLFPFLTKQPKHLRKIFEFAIATAISIKWEKRQVLWLWANLVPMPHGQTGLASAAWMKWGVALSKLNAAEQKQIVSWAKAPGRVKFPFVIPNPSLQFQLIAEQIDEAEKTNLGEQSEHVLQLKVKSHLEGKLQAALKASIERQLVTLEKQNVTSAAGIVVENSTGHVVAYVANGTRDQSWVDLVQSRRQAGSVLKPFLYGVAFESGLLMPSTLLADRPVSLPTEVGLYSPRNYDRKFAGPVTAAEALARSLNVPAVQVLEWVGVPSYLTTLSELWFSQAYESKSTNFGPSLALGAIDVSPWEVAQAFQALANGGQPVPLSLFRPPPGSGKAGDSYTSYKNRGTLRKPNLKAPFSKETAETLRDILSNTQLRSKTFGVASPLEVGAAAKTGTSVDMRDNWCAGFNSTHTVVVWVGNPDGSPMWGVSGVEGAAPIWSETMEFLNSKNNNSVSETTYPSHINQKTNISASASPLRITQPVEGDVFARDPSIPKNQERLLFSVESSNMDLDWYLNNVLIHSGKETLLEWELIPGKHTLQVVPSKTRNLKAQFSAVSFVVKE
jgi:penicillin-binding protein 1C